MPSVKRPPAKASSRRQISPRPSAAHGQIDPKNTAHFALFPLLFLVLVVWVIYRALLPFPVWFDETIGKAIFFGLPVWMYISLTQSKSIRATFAPEQFQPGLMLGVAVGGVFGFAGVLTTLITRRVYLEAAPVFVTNGFWWEFFLALMTGFWESLFFFCWVMVAVQEKYRRWPLVNQVWLVAIIFLLFHIPNTILRFPLIMVPSQLALLFFFAVGQAFLFARSRNLYALALSHAIWGMVLVVHTR